MAQDVTQHDRRIVVGVDGSVASKAALTWAIGQAIRTGAVVEPVIAYHWFPMPIQEVDFKGLAERLLAEEVREARQNAPDVSVVSKVARGDPARVLLEASHGADLLVVGNRGKGGFAEALLGSVSQHCVQHSGCPVAVLRETPDPGGREPLIVVGVDGSPSSKAALRWAIRQATVTGMAIEAIIAWSIPSYYGYTLVADGIESADFAGIASGTIADAIEEVGGAGGHVSITPAVVHGDAAQVLVEASARAALLVVGNRGHRVLAEALLGSVSQRSVHHAACPVVVVREQATA
jgi:nucleotide-binding universal stress UspA family protein